MVFVFRIECKNVSLDVVQRIILKPMIWKTRMPFAFSRQGTYQFRLFFKRDLKKGVGENGAKEEALAPQPPKSRNMGARVYVCGPDISLGDSKRSF